MRPWRLRLTARRSRVQWALLSVVLLVSTLAATLLGTLYLLTYATETFAARAATSALDEADLEILHRLTPHAETSIAEVGPVSAKAAQEHLGSLPASSRVHAESFLLNVPRPDARDAMSYVTTFSDLESIATLLDGRWPQDIASGAEVVVPPRFLWETDTAIGDTIEVARVGASQESINLSIVGTYVSENPGEGRWTLDRYRGEAYRPNQAVPYTNNMIFTDGIGALLTTETGLDGVTLSGLTVQYLPDFSAASVADLRAVIDASADADKNAQRHIASFSNGVDVITNVDVALGAIVGSLAITNSSVLVTALLLLVLSVAALSQTAKLMAERRHAEQHLMAARGGSMRQMFALGLLEALLMAAVTAGAAAPLARLAYLQLSSLDAMASAGMNRDPGLPIGIWIVTGVVGLSLLVVLVAPLLKRAGSFVDAEQAKSRPGRRAAFQRSGLDLGVVALAALAYWQLRSYRSPVLEGGGVASVDPLLAAGPALALLAGGLVAVRLIPAASKIFETFATNGRRATMPLAAWEVGRRAPRAVSAVLLLTLATSIGTFAVSFLSTWQQSQRDQAHFQHPADIVISGVEGSALGEYSLVAAASQGHVSPVIDLAAEIDAAPSGNVSSADSRFNGRGTWLVATDNEGMKFYGEGRVGESAGHRVPSSLAQDDPEDSALALPEGTEGVRMSVTAAVPSATLYGSVATLNAVLRDGSGRYITTSLGQIPVDGEPRVLTAYLGALDQSESVTGPLSLVGVQLFTYVADGIELPGSGQIGLTFVLTLDDISAVSNVTPVPVQGVPAMADEVPLNVPSGTTWFPSTFRMSPTNAAPGGTEGDIVAAAIVTPTSLTTTGARLVLTSEPVLDLIPFVGSSAALDSARIEVGDPMRLSIDGVIYDGWIAQRLPRLPGDHLRAPAVAAHIHDIQLAMVQRGLEPAEPSQYWLAGSSDDAAHIAAASPAWEVTSREGLAQSFALGPLRIAIQAALWIVAGAAAVLAAVGFAVHGVVTMRAREIEFAQLRAVGLQRSQLLRVVTTESILLAFLGTAFGVALGVALAYLVAPLISVGSDGRLPIPSVIVTVPWPMVALLLVEVAAVVTLTVVIIGAMLRRINPPQMLRMGDER